MPLSVRCEHEQRLGDERQPVADLRDPLADEEEPEVAVPQRSERLVGEALEPGHGAGTSRCAGRAAVSSFEDVERGSEASAVGVAQVAQLAREPLGAPGAAGFELALAARGDRDPAHPPVLLVAETLDEPLPFECVDDLGDRGRCDLLLRRERRRA